MSPFWEPYREAITQRIFSINVDLPTNPWFGLGVIVAALLYHYGAMRIEHEENASDIDARNRRKEGVIEHDKRAAEMARTIFSEKTKQKLVRDLLNQHAYWDTESNALADVMVFLDFVKRTSWTKNYNVCAPFSRS